MAIADVLGSDADHLDAESLHGFDCQVTVVIVVEHVLRGKLGLGPVDSAVFNSVADAQDDQTIADFLEQVLNEAVLDLHGVNPKTEGTLLTVALNIIVDQTSGLELLLGQLLEAVLAIEHSGNEYRVNLGVTFAKILSANAVFNAHSSGACEHLARSLRIIGLLESIESAVSAVELVEDIDALAAIFEVFSQVGNLFLTSSTQVEVHPSDEDLLRLELLQVS